MEIYDAYGNRIYYDREPVRYAEFWQRVVAYFLDVLIIMVPLQALEWLILGPKWRDNRTAIFILSVLSGWLYDALQESGPYMATFGKRALGMKVTDMDGHRITFLQATGRHFGKIISGLLFCIGYAMVIWDDKRQALHDKIARTLVLQSQQ